MPIRYRHFYLHKLIETVQKQQEDINKKMESIGSNKTSSPNKKNSPRELPPIPDFAHKTKAPKK
jgi:hypothetical protein